MGISVTQLVIIMVIVILLFGTKRLRSIGSDLGVAIKSFRTSVKEGEEDKQLSRNESEKLEDSLAVQDQSKV